MFRHARSMHLYHHGLPLPLLSEWLGHAQIETTFIYARANMSMKRAAIEKATQQLNPLKSTTSSLTFDLNDEHVIKKMYGLK